MILGLITLGITILYVIFITWCLHNWDQIEDKSTAVLTSRNIKVAVIIPARNESVNLPVLLEALMMQNYPEENFSIIVCDDHSTDQTYETAEAFFRDRKAVNGICLRSPLESKKKAIAFAVENTKAELIITTDADTHMGKDWIASIVQEYITTGSALICGPVKLSGRSTYFEKLQSAEFTGLIGISAATIYSGYPMFCNGANLAFTRKIFYDVKGYEKSASSSGDDTQLLMKIHKTSPGKISFLKDKRAVVETMAMDHTADFWNQRRRWASKIVYTLSAFTISISLLAWLVHVFLFIQFVNLFIHQEILFLFLTLAMKTISELVFLRKTGRFLNERVSGFVIISAQLFYCFYIFCIGLLAPFGTYNWKGRRLR